MNQSRLRFFAAAVLAIVLSVVPSSLKADDAGPKGIEGSWIGTVTPLNPPGVPGMRSLISFTRDGIAIESRRLYVGESPFGPLMETTAHGAWTSIGKNEFSVRFTFLTQRGPISDGSSIGTDNITMHLTLDDSGDILTGTFVSEIRDDNENTLFVANGTVQSGRIKPPAIK
jgi:hypothetical protein